MTLEFAAAAWKDTRDGLWKFPRTVKALQRVSN